MEGEAMTTPVVKLIAGVILVCIVGVILCVMVSVSGCSVNATTAARCPRGASVPRRVTAIARMSSSSSVRASKMSASGSTFAAVAVTGAV